MPDSFQDLDLNLLRLIDSIDKHGSISATARHLNLTQPAVSHALNRLRDALGQPVFIRQGNQMIATEQTRQMLPFIQYHLAGLHQALSQQPSFQPATLNTTYQCGIHDVLEAQLFPHLIPRLCKLAPNVNLLSHRIARQQIEAALLAGDVDVVLDRQVWVNEQIRHQIIDHDRQCIVVHRGHPLTKQAFDLATYLKHEHVAVNHPDAPEKIDHWLADRGEYRNIRLRCQHYLSACHVLMNTDWLLTMPEGYARDLAQLLPLSLIPFPAELPVIELVLYWHQRLHDVPAHRWLREQIVEAWPHDRINPSTTNLVNL
jgi:DNA-binding transcriptional LysR family regulator